MVWNTWKVTWMSQLNTGVGSSVVYIIGPVKSAFSLETVYVFLSGVTLLLVLNIVVLLVASRKIHSLRN